MLEQPGILGTSASLGSDASLLAYLLGLVPLMLIGFVFARRKMFVPHHKIVMTLVVVLNWIIIGIIMATSYADGVAPYLSTSLSDPRVLIPTLHGILGLIAQVLGTYLVLRMWFENALPEWVKVKRIKRYMRLTLTLWLVTAALGVVTYISFYTPTASAEGGNPPAATLEPAATSEATPDPAATSESGEAGSTGEPATPEATEETGSNAESRNTNQEGAASAATAIPTVDHSMHYRAPATTEDVPAPATTEEVSATQDHVHYDIQINLNVNVYLFPPGLFGSFSTQNVPAPVATEDASVPAPQSTPEVLPPAATVDVPAPAATEDVPAPAQTPELFDDSDNDNDDENESDDSDNSGMGMGS